MAAKKNASSVKKSPGKKPKQAAKSAPAKAGKAAPAKATKLGKAAPAKAAKKNASSVKKSPGKKSKQAAKPAPMKAGKPAPAKAGPTGVGVGEQAPSFELPDQDGNLLSSASLAGAPYVIYFYPKDDTPGCTKEACGFQEEQPAFQSAGVRVIGVSPDSPARHIKFRQKYGLEFTLLADVDKQLAEAYGVWVMKQNYGREYMGIQRSTFLVDAKGQIAQAWRNVRVNGHVDAVLGAI